LNIGGLLPPPANFCSFEARRLAFDDVLLSSILKRGDVITRESLLSPGLRFPFDAI
jgi:hypothetical protein